MKEEKIIEELQKDADAQYGYIDREEMIKEGAKCSQKAPGESQVCQLKF